MRVNTSTVSSIFVLQFFVLFTFLRVALYWLKFELYKLRFSINWCNIQDRRFLLRWEKLLNEIMKFKEFFEKRHLDKIILLQNVGFGAFSFLGFWIKSIYFSWFHWGNHSSILMVRFKLVSHVLTKHLSKYHFDKPEEIDIVCKH